MGSRVKERGKLGNGRKGVQRKDGGGGNLGSCEERGRVLEEGKIISEKG